jgi:catechol 2,3-dioxygenase-like lactoylglutathione lyase family enzyme
MKALGLTWRREIPTERFEPTATFYRDVMGLKEERLEEDFAILRLPVEIFGPSRAGQEQFATGPMVGFRVEDVVGARGGGGRGGRDDRPGTHRRRGGRLVSFRGPDDEVYEIAQLPDAGLRR